MVKTGYNIGFVPLLINNFFLSFFPNIESFEASSIRGCEPAGVRANGLVERKFPSTPRQESNHDLVKPQAPPVGLQLHINKECSNCCIELIDLVIYFAKSNKELPVKRRRAKVFSFAMISFGRLLKRRIQKRTIRDIHRRAYGRVNSSPEFP